MAFHSADGLNKLITCQTEYDFDEFLSISAKESNLRDIGERQPQLSEIHYAFVLDTGTKTWMKK